MQPSGARFVAKIGAAEKNRDGKPQGLSAVAIGNRQSGRWPSKDVPERSLDFRRVEGSRKGRKRRAIFPPHARKR